MNPSYRIVFYVSGHGFGHTSRTIEVIHAVLRARPEAQIVVKTSAPHRLFARSLRLRSGQALDCELVELQCDAGMVQIDSLNMDTAESIRRAVEFQARLPSLIAAEAAYLRDTGARVVVADIPPLGIASAHAAGIPSVAIANFTWDWIYEGYRDDAAFDVARDMRRHYSTAATALRLPMAGGFAGLESVVRDIPFVARHSARSQDEVRGALGLPPRASGKPLVLMSFGGYGVAGLDVMALAALTDYTIATTDSPSNNNVISRTTGLLYISEQQVYDGGLRYEDLVRGADVVVTKPGYGIISEAIANDTALLYTSRGHFVEYDVLVREMPKYLRARFIEQTDLLKGNWKDALEKLLSQPAPPERPALNGADVAAAEILRQG
jgi:UDP:flavonoid glycosyltransferase YjiC (YdhE family)